jgi:hypothetical protein
MKTQKEIIKDINAQTKKIKKRNAKKLIEQDGLHTVYKGRVVAKESTVKCPSCGRKYPLSEFDGYECMTCAKLRAELMDDLKYEHSFDDGHDYDWEKRRDYIDQNMPNTY